MRYYKIHIGMIRGQKYRISVRYTDIDMNGRTILAHKIYIGYYIGGIFRYNDIRENMNYIPPRYKNMMYIILTSNKFDTSNILHSINCIDYLEQQAIRLEDIIGIEREQKYFKKYEYITVGTIDERIRFSVDSETKYIGYDFIILRDIHRLTNTLIEKL